VRTHVQVEAAVNVPLNDGIDDESYIALFKEVIGACTRTYQPGAIGV
jgi:histone deacetylase HOS2